MLLVAILDTINNTYVFKIVRISMEVCDLIYSIWILIF